MKHIESNWKSTDGLTLSVQGWEPDTTPIKAVVCLVHGIAETGFDSLSRFTVDFVWA